MEILPLTGGLGAEVKSADLHNPADIEAMREAFAQYGVMCIRGQKISPEDHIAFAKHWGSINVNRFFAALDTHPEIAVVLKEAHHTQAVGENWHTDHSYDTVPAMGSILHAIETPSFGGDTVFCSMAAAYDALSAPVRDFIGKLQAWHSSRHVFGTLDDKDPETEGRYKNAAAAKQDVLHPMVIRHPLSGRPCVYVNPVFTTRIDGVSPQESRALLEMLYAHCQQPEFQCRVRWEPGDVTMWDNRATWHKAINDYPGQRRYMHRITVEGCALTAA